MMIQDIVHFLVQRAPLDTAEDWDNVGLLIGSPDREVCRVLVALDITPAAIEAAKGVKADLVISHHPVIFSPLKSVDRNSVPYRLIEAGVDALCLHTNLDKAEGGVNDTLAALLELDAVVPTPDGMGRIGTLPQTVKANDFARHVAQKLGCTVRINGGDRVQRIAVCGGSGGDLIESLLPLADAFVTGEVRHHEWLAANAGGITVIEAGHYATEIPVVDTLCHWLTEQFPTLSVTPYYEGEPYGYIH